MNNLLAKIDIFKFRSTVWLVIKMKKYIYINQILPILGDPSKRVRTPYEFIEGFYD